MLANPVSINVSMSIPASSARSLAVAIALEKAISMGFISGQYGGRNVPSRQYFQLH